MSNNKFGGVLHEDFVLCLRNCAEYIVRDDKEDVMNLFDSLEKERGNYFQQFQAAKDSIAAQEDLSDAQRLDKEKEAGITMLISIFNAHQKGLQMVNMQFFTSIFELKLVGGLKWLEGADEAIDEFFRYYENLLKINHVMRPLRIVSKLKVDCIYKLFGDDVDTKKEDWESSLTVEQKAQYDPLFEAECERQIDYFKAAFSQATCAKNHEVYTDYLDYTSLPPAAIRKNGAIDHAVKREINHMRGLLEQIMYNTEVEKLVREISQEDGNGLKGFSEKAAKDNHSVGVALMRLMTERMDPQKIRGAFEGYTPESGAKFIAAASIAQNAINAKERYVFCGDYSYIFV